ncbi:hypothetical protein R1sor_004626 [Riccia sorocarpa]|uniref:Uncharacterized protein n=1 Tax=Riccia sorocarpa TaxID=122646 RepID=A0ABD3HH87_9MARC
MKSAVLHVIVGEKEPVKPTRRVGTGWLERVENVDDLSGNFDLQDPSNSGFSFDSHESGTRIGDDSVTPLGEFPIRKRFDRAPKMKDKEGERQSVGSLCSVEGRQRPTSFPGIFEGSVSPLRLKLVKQWLKHNAVWVDHVREVVHHSTTVLSDHMPIFVDIQILPSGTGGKTENYFKMNFYDLQDPGVLKEVRAEKALLKKQESSLKQEVVLRKAVLSEGSLSEEEAESFQDERLLKEPLRRCC